MRDPREVQLAWFTVEFLQTMVDLIWDHYEEDFKEDIEPQKCQNNDDSWDF